MLQTKFDYGKQLDHAFLKQSTGDLTSKISHIGDKVDNFQTELAGYFKSLAVYDNERANQDLAGARYWYVIGTVSMKRYKRKNEKSSRYAC